MASAVLPQHVQITTPDLRDISQPAHIDPDISATLSDFLTYTEHLPSSIQRSLTLINDQDRIASDLQQTIHELLTTYTHLPKLKDAADAVTLRRDISHAYDRLGKARRMAAAESLRMADLVAKDRARLDFVTRKLKAMPMPPSRDPTPEPVSSPHLRKAQPTSEKRAAHRTGTAPRVRGRKIMIPGEVLPPPNPDSPPPSEISDWNSPPPSPVPARKERQKSVGRQRTPKPPKLRKESTTPRTVRVRTPGQPGTNVHSAVAGISTSNALLALVPPPEDAQPGSRWRPWKRLTEFELAKLRKRMKKNAIWLPSPAMRNRELKVLGRGQQAMELAKADAEASGQDFVDEFAPDWSDPTKAVVSGEERAEINAMLGPEADGGDGDDALMNRGMRLNEAKKRKREKQLEEAAIQAQIDSENGRTPERKKEVPEIAKSPKAPKTVEKKRKRESTPPPATNPANIDPSLLESPDVLSRPVHQPKKLKLSIPAPTSRRGPSPINSATGTKVPLAPAAPSPNKAATNTKPLPSPRPRSRHASLAPDAAAKEVAPTSRSNTPATRKPSTKITIKPSKAASAEPPNRRISLRRGSNASLPGSQTEPKLTSPAPIKEPEGRGGRRKRRPAPGLMITVADEGSAKVTVGTRRTAPKKKGGIKKEDAKDTKEVPAAVEPEEFIDPDEPRYCVCGDVSWGTMIACDNEDCDKEWFHLECVALTEMPPRRTKWYCPDCRKKLKLGVATNGIVRP